MFHSTPLVRQVVTLIPVFAVCFLKGLNTGWLAPNLRRSQTRGYGISLDSKQRSWLAAVQEPARVAGMITCVLYVDTIGRKKAITFCFFLIFAGWTLVRCCEHVLGLYISRVLFGIALGVLDTSASIYIGENSIPQIRSICCSITIATFYFGLDLEFVLASYLPYNTVSTFNLVIVSVSLLCALLLRETTHFLLLSGKVEKAQTTFARLFMVAADDVSANVEFQKIQLNIGKYSESLNVKQLLSVPSYYKSVAIMVPLSLIMYSTGYWTLMSFVSMTFSSSTSFTENHFTIFYGFVQFVASFVASFYIEKFYRRTILLASVSVAFLAHTCTAILFYVHENLASVPYFAWFIFGTITLYSSIYSAGMVPIHLLLRSELFPQKVKPLGCGLSTLANSLSTFFTSILFLKIARNYGTYVNFVFFALLSLATFLFTYFFVPETKGKTLLEIETLFDESQWFSRYKRQT